ncbi:MAG: glycosyltransferase [Vicinamibacterales bacterium]
MTHPTVDGKFLRAGDRRFLIKGVAYGTFAPDVRGEQFPAPARVAQDFQAMQAAGINTVRLYTVPSPAVLDEAARHDLRLIVGIPWAQHVAFLDDRRAARRIRREAAATVRSLAGHPAALLFALGNEIPPSVVRWHGEPAVERFLRGLYDEVKAAAPAALLTYVNYPPTEYLDTECYDVASFNVYLHRETDLRAYLARLQQIAGHKPLLLAEAGADSLREGLDGQAAITSMHLRAAFREGLCGAVAYSWTDEWWRGGQAVEDWAFGLVDRDRQPKPALAAVAQAFAEAPFPREAQQAWPSVSVVVCAYNAADTLDDCLTALTGLTYPDVEIVVVNDGSTDATSAIARRYAGVRVLDTPNAGLSAARNVGLSHARGEIVAYTDADVRVDPDWLTYLVQPFLHSDVVAAGGPNVVPHDDPFVAQCVARAPGGPTHVLLDDRIAEHVPGCNMAYRREALLAIGGFNPVFLRAGDDVDVCWRLQAKGQQIGFAPSALVWHHHRTSVQAYWRQQVGYGEGETWLDAHHPEKFVHGSMVWRGRIYSPLPFVRSLSGRRVNTGVWGTAAFPSVYRTDVHAFQFLPHSPRWLLVSTVLCAVGALALASPFPGSAVLLLLAGVAGWLITLARCAAFGWNADLRGLPTIGAEASRFRHRALIGWLHLIQPFARFYGRVKGLLSPPLVVEPDRVTRLPWKPLSPSRQDLGAAVIGLVGGAHEETFWGETWISPSALLAEVAGLLRASRPARQVAIDDGWRADRDVSIALGTWGWLDLRVLIEEHGGGRVLLRSGLRLRPAQRGVVVALALGLLAVAMTSAAVALRWPWLSIASVSGVGAIFARAVWQTTTASALARQAVQRAAAGAGMIPMPRTAGTARARRVTLRPATLSQAMQAVVAIALGLSALLTGASIVRDVVVARLRPVATSAVGQATGTEPDFDGAAALAMAPDGELVLSDARDRVIRRLDPRVFDERLSSTIELARSDTGLPFQSPADMAVAANGDVFVADARNDRISRIDRATGAVTLVAGSGDSGFAGDLGPAIEASLHGPAAVAVAANGDVYIADTLNNRVRVVAQATGHIRTVAGDGLTGEADAIGDGGPALLAHLDRPADLALAPNGDLYIADMGHHRVRRVDGATGVIETVAGTGTAGLGGDGGPAVHATLSAPAGLALATASGGAVTLYIADYHNGSVRVVLPGGLMATVGGPRQFVSPTRLAYRPDGWLYVASDTGALSAVRLRDAPAPAPVEATTPRRRKVT